MDKVLKLLVGVYMFSLLIAIPYFNWQIANEYGFVRWLFFGEFVATAKGVVWPYFVAMSYLSDEPSVKAKNASSSAYSQKEPYEVHCTEPLPPFTLGRNSNPTKAQETTLCACIWQKLRHLGTRNF